MLGLLLHVDPDELQDELNDKWVQLWKEAAKNIDF